MADGSNEVRKSRGLKPRGPQRLLKTDVVQRFPDDLRKRLEKILNDRRTNESRQDKHAPFKRSELEAVIQRLQVALTIYTRCKDPNRRLLYPPRREQLDDLASIKKLVRGLENRIMKKTNFVSRKRIFLVRGFDLNFRTNSSYAVTGLKDIETSLASLSAAVASARSRTKKYEYDDKWANLRFLLGELALVWLETATKEPKVQNAEKSNRKKRRQFADAMLQGLGVTSPNKRTFRRLMRQVEEELHRERAVSEMSDESEKDN